MKKYLLFLLLSGLTLAGVAQTVSGIIRDEQLRPLAGVSVVLKGSKRGTVTDSTGAFQFGNVAKFPVRLAFSLVGYQEEELLVKEQHAVSLTLHADAKTFDEIVISASRQREDKQRAAVTIEKLGLRALQETPAASFYDALGNVKGVQMTTASLTYKVPNTRGFNVPNNFRFMQLVDGVDVQAATLGVPLGNTIGPTELDIQSIEITPGASSALYGMNAINGMSQLFTKNPFTSQGLSVYQKVGVNHVNDDDHSASLLTETSIRYAKAFNNKFAFKINASYFKGTDWIANNKNDFNPQPIANPLFPELSGSNNPAYDGVNSYGNESDIRITDKNKQSYNVRRTGYSEKDLTDYGARNLKLDAAIHYKIRPNLEASYSYRIGTMDGVFQRGNRIRLQGVKVQNHKVELAGSSFVVRAYMSLENSGDSYALKPLSDNLETAFKSKNVWAADYKKALDSALTVDSKDLAGAHKAARTYADKGRFQPGTYAFDTEVAKLNKINDWDKGSAMKTSSHFYQVEGTWNLNKYVKWINVLVGADYRLYDLIPDGNNFVDFSKPIAERNTPGGKDIHYGKSGGFVQVTKQLLDDKLKLTGSLRYDKSTEFEGKFNPRVAVVYTLNKVHNFRASWQNGFRFPSLFEAYSFVNNGGVKRVGGLPIVEQGLNYYTNSLYTSSVTAFNTAVNTSASQQGITPEEAATQPDNYNLLKVANPQPIKPEQISSYEVGYKGALLDNHLLVDAEAYFNNYKYFIGQVEVSVPGSGNISNISDPALLTSLLNTSTYAKYRVWANSNSSVKVWGYAAGVTYNFSKSYTASANANYNKLSQTNANDQLIPGFNTPNWATNVSFGNRAVTKNVGYNLVWHWQNSFYWQNLFGNGNIPAYSTLDAQVTFKVPTLSSSFKVGGANVLNRRYLQYIGGPTIGALYYVSWTLDLPNL